ncbi:protein SEH1-like isoform X2 [Aristolochia californica]|uniref:protein SEH1-like isoform X2 n=1 Tax=Aristolochia californica TaxID=171875 RepID=UPI0035E293A4
MEKHLIALDKGATCSAWNYCSLRMAAGATDGTVSIYDSPEQGSPSFVRSFKWKAHEKPVVKLQWVPPEYGDAVACICADGTVSLWEEIEEDTLMWKLCKVFEGSGTQALDLQFGVTATNLKLVIAYSDGHVKVYELLDPLELNKWQLQAEFQNVIDSVSRFVKPSCSSASIAWIPQRGANHQSSFALGFNSDLPQFNSSKVWEFDEAYQRWLPVADLALPGESDDPVSAIGWAPNIGRPYEVLAVATTKGITIWHLKLNSETDGRLPVEKVALLSGHDGEEVLVQVHTLAQLTNLYD